MEDHAGDDWRYQCMSRPWVKPIVTTTKPERDSYRHTGARNADNSAAVL
jgi:hypothetical protein